jgi:tRNA/tmRNA/rRNA uracil-C5-methylase (TrmA/RlmC/RlmD family)
MQPFQVPNETLANNPACNPVCRACHYKSLTYLLQVERKQAWVSAQLQRWQSVLSPLIPASHSEQTGYRSKSWMRTEFKDGQVSFGMIRSVRNQSKWEKEFISWDSCPLHHLSIQKIIKNLKQALSPDQIQTLQASWVGVWFGRPHVVIISKQAEIGVFQTLKWDQILAPPYENIWFHFNPQVGKKIFGHHEIQRIAGCPTESIHPIRAFRQVAQGLLIQARQLALKHLLLNEPEFILDLYCGTGDLALMLPQNVGWLGLEISPEAVEYANTLRNSDSVFHLAFTGAIEDRLKDPRVLSKISGNYSIFINPPRSGMSHLGQDRLIQLMRSHAPSTLVYLSCSASSLARDLVTFENEGYSVELLQPYDFFPQTEHFEILAVLKKRD